MPMFKAVQGTRDILPDQAAYWRYLENVVSATCERYGFQRIETPIFEETGVFARGVGEGTDIVEKEMYTFKDRSETSLTLQPEGTAGVVRAYIEHGMQMKPQPVKVYYLRTPIFRYERPQKGRLREHHQFGCEAIGEADPAVDAEMIALIWDIYIQLGVTGISVNLNSIGDKNCKPGYLQELIAYYTPLQDDLCDDCKVRFIKNPLRLLDCKEARDQDKIANAPKITEALCEDCATHFATLRTMLETMRIPYQINPLLVRGLDYYSRTVFELIPEKDGRRQSAIGGGGRYDGLVELLGGKPTPGIGFGSGMERAIALLEEQQTSVPDMAKPSIYLATIGSAAKLQGAAIAHELRLAGINAQLGFGERSLKALMKAANTSGARWAMIIGEDELAVGDIIVRNLAASADTLEDQKQWRIKRNKVLSWVQDQLI